MKKKFKNNIINRYVVYIFIILLSTSCGTGLKISAKDYTRIDTSFSGTYTNVSYIPKGKERRTGTYNILNLFYIFDESYDAVTFSFVNDHQLKLSYTNELGSKEAYFNGKFSKRGYFQVYHKKNKIEIPPLFPILYSNVSIDRIRIGTTKDNDLVIDDYDEVGGNIFILAGGHASRTQYYFNKKKL